VRLRSEDGSAVIEFPLAVAVLLIPMAYFALMFAPWSERHSAAELAAAEAARIIVTSSSNAANESDAVAIAFQILDNFGISASEASVTLCPNKPGSGCGTLNRGETIRVEVQVSMPAVVIPLADSDGSALTSPTFSITASHDERVDAYRSFTP
jgi:Flp pilus assembly protein TadG